MRKFTKTYLVGGLAAAVVLAGVGSALAYWTDSGSGSGTATTGSSTPYTVTVTPANGNAALSPGGATDNYTFTVKNVGSGNQSVSSATAKIANSDGSTWTAVTGCTSADFTVSAATVTAAVLAPAATTPGAFTVTMKDTGVNQNACKGATIPLYVSVN